MCNKKRIKKKYQKEEPRRITYIYRDSMKKKYSRCRRALMKKLMMNIYII